MPEREVMANGVQAIQLLSHSPQTSEVVSEGLAGGDAPPITHLQIDNGQKAHADRVLKSVG